MIPARIHGCTAVLGKPKDWNEDRDGPCSGLPVRIMRGQGGLVTQESAWTPSPDELARLNAGASVILAVMSAAHPPVMLTVGDPP